MRLLTRLKGHAMTLLLSNEDVRAAVTMFDAIEAMEAAFLE